MELVCKLIAQDELQEREYEREGVKEKFASMRLQFQRGQDTFYGEMVQETARKAPRFALNTHYLVDMSVKGRKFESKDRREMVENRVVVNRMVEF